MSQQSLPPCSRSWRTRAEKRRLPLFDRMAKGKSLSPGYVPMPDIAGKGTYFTARSSLHYRLTLECWGALLKHIACEGYTDVTASRVKLACAAETILRPCVDRARCICRATGPDEWRDNLSSTQFQAGVQRVCAVLPRLSVLIEWRVR